jgi:transposase
LLYRRRRNLSDEDRLELERLAELGPQYALIKQAYDLKEDFLELYHLRTTAAGVRAYDRWAGQFPHLPDVIRDAFRELLTAMSGWKREVFNFIEHRYSNGSIERVNRMIKDLSRAGCSLDTIRAKMVNKTFRRASSTRKDASGHSGKSKRSAQSSNTQNAAASAFRKLPHQPLLPMFPIIAIRGGRGVFSS